MRSALPWSQIGEAIRMRLTTTASATVIRLRLSVRPSTVAGLVVAIIINSIERIFRSRSRSHVGKETLERSPTLTDSDPTAAIVRKRMIIRILATLPHRIPERILWRAPQAMSAQMQPPEAAARNRFRINIGKTIAATIAVCMPKIVAPAAVAKYGKYQSSTPNSGPIFHSNIYTRECALWP